MLGQARSNKEVKEKKSIAKEGRKAGNGRMENHRHVVENPFLFMHSCFPNFLKNHLFRASLNQN